MHQIIISYNANMAPLAQQEMQNFDSKAVLKCTISTECALYNLPQDPEILFKQWNSKPPVFIRHVFPVLKVVPLTLTNKDTGIIQKNALDFINLLNSSKSFSVQNWFIGNFFYKPFEINSLISKEVLKKTPCKLNVRNPDQVISILCSRNEKNCYMGISLVENNLSTWAGGVLKYKRSENQISRSELKLLEAIDTFNIDVSTFKNALDLGAAPGGWSRILSEKGIKVTTIDTGELKSELINSPNIRYLKITTQQHLRTNKESFDIICCDMKMDAVKASKLILNYSKYLKTNGLVIMTLKLPKKVSLTNTILKDSLNILSQGYIIKHVKCLFYNRNELTLILSKVSPQLDPNFKSAV